MNDPLLWLHGDPTGQRDLRAPKPADDPPPAQQPPPPPLPPQRARRGGRFGAALAGGAVSAALVTGGLFSLGVLDQDAAAPAAPAAVGARQAGDVAAISAVASPSVVSIRTSSGSGTGFVVDDDGTVVTNAHVVGSEDEVRVSFVNERTVTGRVAGVDTSSDLAIVMVDPSETGALRPLALADSGAVRTGQLAVAIGSPFGLDQTTTAGIVSGTGRHIQAPDGFQIDRVIQTDAPINPGNSGGPLLDAQGRVIGVNSQIAGSSGGNVGIGFAVPSNTVRDVIPRLKQGQTVARPYLGVSTGADQRGAVISEAVAGGPAANAGLRAGDVIVRVADQQVTDPDDVAAAIQDRRPGEKIAVEIERDGSRQTIEVELGTRPEQSP